MPPSRPARLRKVIGPARWAVLMGDVGERSLQPSGGNRLGNRFGRTAVERHSYHRGGVGRILVRPLGMSCHMVHFKKSVLWLAGFASLPIASGPSIHSIACLLSNKLYMFSGRFREGM